jgi:hypothetical protein
VIRQVPAVALDRRAVVRTALVCGIGGTVVGLCAAAVAIPNGQVTVGVVLRSVLVAVLLTAALPSSLSGLRPPVDEARLQPSVLVGAALGYLVDPLSWVGRAFVSQLLGDPGVLTALADLALWVALAWAGCTLRVRVGHRGAVPRDSTYLQG